MTSWNKNMVLRFYLLIIFNLILQSCSLDSIDRRIAPGYVEAFRTIKNSFIDLDNELITPELIENIPYASLTLKIGRGAPGLLILESVDGNKQTWVSADGVYLVLEKGRIIKTAGLFNNLVNFKTAKNDFADLMDSKSFETLINYYSYDVPELNDLRVVAKRQFIQMEQVKLLSFEKSLHLIDENISNDFIGWKRQNKFWVDDENFIWKSEQFISPKLPKFQIEITKKPAI